MSTRLQLRTRVRYNLRESNPSSAPRYDNASINSNLNEAYQQYQLELIENAQGDFATKTFISLVANQDLYALPSTWVKTRKLWKIEADGRYEIERSERRDWPVYKIDSISRNNPFTYRYQDRSILLEPAPLSSESNAILHEYYTLQSDLTDDSHSPVAGFIEPWQTMLVLYATIAELEGKEAIGSVVSIDTFRGRLEKAEMRFRASMVHRSEANDTVSPDDL